MVRARRRRRCFGASGAIAADARGVGQGDDVACDVSGAVVAGGHDEGVSAAGETAGVTVNILVLTARAARVLCETLGATMIVLVVTAGAARALHETLGAAMIVLVVTTESAAGDGRSVVVARWSIHRVGVSRLAERRSCTKKRRRSRCQETCRAS
jgi:hypothetical protein